VIALALHTFRECLRRSFPYVAFVAILLLAIASRLFLAFSFGAEQAESLDLTLSAVFVAGFAVAAFQGTALVRGDLERGTLALVLTKPTGLLAYLSGRLLGLFAASATLCAAMACACAAGLALLPAGPAGPPPPGAIALAAGRCLLAVLVLDAASLAVSAVAPRTVAPVALIALFVAGSLLGRTVAGFLLPDFSVFGLEAQGRPPLPLLAAYAAVFSSAFLLVAYIFLASKAPLRSQS
jgi:ABC-2 type transport system permease protein